MPIFEIVEIRPSWPDMRHVEFRMDGASWRDGSVPAEAAGSADDLTVWLTAKEDRYLADMAAGNAPGDPQ